MSSLHPWKAGPLAAVTPSGQHSYFLLAHGSFGSSSLRGLLLLLLLCLASFRKFFTSASELAEQPALFEPRAATVLFSQQPYSEKKQSDGQSFWLSLFAGVTMSSQHPNSVSLNKSNGKSNDLNNLILKNKKNIYSTRIIDATVLKRALGGHHVIWTAAKLGRFAATLGLRRGRIGGGDVHSWWAIFLIRSLYSKIKNVFKVILIVIFLWLRNVPAGVIPSRQQPYMEAWQSIAARPFWGAKKEAFLEKWGDFLWEKCVKLCVMPCRLWCHF